jgi:thiol-disulfide isomerase/thioredoxin
LNIISNKLATKFPANESIKALAVALKPQNDNPYEMTQTFANGTAIPEITGLNPDGKSISLSSLRGKVVLIDFWASWCGPCRAENPNVVNVYNKYKDKGFDVFSYSLDDNKAKWADAIKKDGLIWPAHASQLKGWDSDICEQFNITSIPTNYLIDRNGNVIAFNLHGGALEQILQKVL